MVIIASAWQCLQRWLGHAQLTTTAIYAEAVDEEERANRRAAVAMNG